METSTAITLIEAIKTTELGQDECRESFVEQIEEFGMDLFGIDHLEEKFVSHQGCWKYENNGHFTTMSVLS